jgi:hypothetical protein
MFKHKGPRRIIAMTNEAYDYENGPLARGYDSAEEEDWIRKSVGYWITDTGEILPCVYDVDNVDDQMHHNNVANVHLNRDDDDGMEIAYDSGWVRVRINDGEFNIEYHSDKITPKAKRMLLKKIDEFDGAFRLEDYKGAHDLYTDKRLLKVAMSRLNNMSEGIVLTGKEEITEALDSKPYKYEFDQVGNNYVATFVTANDVEYETLIDMLGTESNSPVEVIFNINDVYGHPRTGIENTGDARRVFATVIDIVKLYSSIHKPVEIHFFAKEPSRVKLYDAFINRLDRELSEYKLMDSWKKGMTGKHYVLQLKTFDRGNITEVSGTRLKDLCTVKTNFPDADFWLQRSGSESTVGTPTKTFSPDNIGIKVTATDVLDPTYLYYMMMHIHNTGYWKPRATGALRLVHIKASDVANIPIGNN